VRPLYAGVLLSSLGKRTGGRFPQGKIESARKAPDGFRGENSMPATKPALQEAECAPESVVPPRNLTVRGSTGPHLLTQPVARPELHSVPAPVQPRKEANFQPRVPVITGEATYRGSAEVHGIISGQLGAAASTLTIKQRPRNGSSQPELDGELTFKDLLRINGHIAGKVISQKGTLIVDQSATVEADIDVLICVVNGTVVGDIVGHERVEVTPGATVKGNIVTRSLSIKPGAMFHGDCRMLKQTED
jgi:cytoskeletal protein CcmA (bactofilin family)